MLDRKARQEAAHTLKMAEKKLARANRKRGHLANSGNFYPIPFKPPEGHWTPDEVKAMGRSVPGGLRRRLRKTA